MWMWSGREEGLSGAAAPQVAAWETLLTDVEPGQHVAQLYTEHEFLARAVGRFVDAGLRRGEGVVLIITPLHWQLVARQLERLHGEVQNFHQSGQLVVRDAEATLASLLGDGGIRGNRFHETLRDIRDGFARAGFPRIRAFGEMVDLLRHRDLAATIALEELWVDLVAAHGISLLCGYSIDACDPRNYRGLVQKVAGVHTHLIPVEDYARLERAVDRAYADVFGSTGDARPLRDAFVRHFAPAAAMPPAQAAILALKEFVPDSADPLVESVRRHYRSRRA